MLEAHPLGSRIRSLSEYAGLEIIFSEDSIDAEPNELLDYATRVKKYVGVPYGYSDILLLAWVLTAGLGSVPQFVVNRVVSEKRMICSQLVAQFGADFGMDWQCGQADPQLVTPGMLAQRAILQKKG